ncbi:DNA ligase 4-like isoform X1 [Zerene cesonia]|uniref:DNA ligase 4-like isoform X1 n=1 Tax=Zerene cesonia TaxID=33412 RepID=UPI0018E5310F|nr:DNA ligase 4-like isoform X1 [Zerene cesonia]
MEKIPANDILFSEFCILLEQLSKRKKHRQDQDKTLANFINDFRINSGKVTDKKNSTFFPVLRLLLPDRDRDRNPYNLKETKLGSLLVKVLSLNKQSHDAQELLNFRSVHNNAHDSDFAGVAYFVLKNRMTQKSCSLTIGDINKVLDKISTAEVGNKGPVLDDAFSFIIKNLTAEQLKWFLRLILKDLKLAMGTHRTLAAFHPDAPELLDSCGNLSKVCEDLSDGDTRPIELGVKVFYAVSPMLSERLDITRISQLSSDKTYQIEDKFDGERFQIHMEDGVFEYFSRKGFTYASNYGKTYDSGLLTPRLRDCFSPNVKSFILDGEMMGWHKEYQCFGSKGMAFDIKKITENSKYRPCFCAFDVLYYNGKSLIGPPEKGGKTLKERQQILDSMLINVQGVILRSKRQIVKESVDVLNALNKAIENQDEGIVVKDVDSYYIANRRNAGWYKIKPEYTEGAMTDLDLVVIGADEAENKRQGRAKSFHVACLDVTTGQAKRWVAVGRVATGLTFDERETLCALLERKWTLAKRTPPPPCLFFNKDKPDFWILPEYSVVLEVRATELVRSSSTGTEYTLRFPRVTKVRSDKPVDDVLTLQEFQRLVAEKNAVVKLSTKRINQDQIDEVLTKTRRTRTSKAAQVSEKFRAKLTGDVSVTSGALREREVCVLSGDEDCGKAELVRIVETHGGKHVENAGPKTWCCVAGTLSFRIRKLIESNKFDIISASWLRNLAVSDVPCSLSPLDMLSIKKETKIALSLEFDPFGDSYREPIDEDTLKKCLKKMDGEDPIYPTTQEIVELDEQLFSDNNPFSFLRQCSIHFMNDPIRSALAKIYGAKVCDKSDFLTHIVISKESDRQELYRVNNNDDVKVVSREWFDKCLDVKALVPVT